MWLFLTAVGLTIENVSFPFIFYHYLSFKNSCFYITTYLLELELCNKLLPIFKSVQAKV